MIKNISQELPEHLPDGKDIDILVRLDERERYATIMKENRFLYRVHPLGRENGYRFCYQLPEYQFWQKKNIEETMYIDTSFTLMCKSLTPHCWVPLDSSINERVWRCKVWNPSLHCWQLDDDTLLVYLLARCVFDKRFFSDGYCQEIEARKENLSHPVVIDMLQTVFYRFTEELVQLIRDGCYSEIIGRYTRFTDY